MLCPIQQRLIICDPFWPQLGFGEEGKQLASSTMQGTVEFTNLVATRIPDWTSWGLKVYT